MLSAAAPNGLLAVRALPSLGVSVVDRRRWMAEGWLVPVRRGVVMTGGGVPTPWQQAAAAVLAAGEEAVLSHSTAARVHHLYCADSGVPPAGIELTVRRPAHPQLSGCTVHRVLRLGAEEVTTHRGVKVTTPLRTLLDLAPALPPLLLERTIDEGLIARLWEMADLEAALRSGSDRRRLAALREVLAPRLGGQAGGDPLELRAARAVQSLGPFETQYQVVVDGVVYVLDIAWPAYRVAAECDGWLVRSRSRSKFDHDRRRNNRLTSHGWSIVHLTSAMSDDEMREAVFRVLIRAAAG